MPDYTEPSKTNPVYIEPSSKGWFYSRWFIDPWFAKVEGSGKLTPSYTETEKPSPTYTEPDKGS